ncbi:hypothetical protein [Rhizobium leguminosarum]|uniref:hypothetical protein n=1 Tax=Rhizobium leguminosarum TaxID=384 RepID=UPI0010310D19|nr:hypothetical protein [Rhizobium leguminosarum]MBY5421091.1 hypothetical protein [Rhizobium leguminosarum]TBG74399.1 hypothetical protein ELG69_29095 [Rhizobium leguminosarum]
MGAILLFTLSTAANATNVTIYRFENIPDIDGILIKDGQIFAAFGGATVTDAMNTFNKLLELDLQGKQKCTELEHVELGTGWSERPCLTVREFNDEVYEIDVVNRFDFGEQLDAGYIEFLKQEDFVKERRFTFLFSKTGRSCEIKVTKRSYIPIEGGKPKASRIGSGVCTVRKH